MNAIDSDSLERDAGGKPVPTFPHPALEVVKRGIYAALLFIRRAIDRLASLWPKLRRKTIEFASTQCERDNFELSTGLGDKHAQSASLDCAEAPHIFRSPPKTISAPNCPKRHAH